MRCTIVMEQNAGESAVYDGAGRKIYEDRGTVDNWEALDIGCDCVRSRFAALDERCAIYRCETIHGPEATEYDCETVWPDQLSESWLEPEESPVAPAGATGEAVLLLLTQEQVDFVRRELTQAATQYGSWAEDARLSETRDSLSAKAQMAQDIADQLEGRAE